MDDAERRQYCIEWMTTEGQAWLETQHEPEPGSALAGDDKLQPPVSKIAAFALAVALDHLGSVTDALTDERPMRHFSPFSALRATLLTASQATWILAPTTRKERQANTFGLAITNLIEQRKAMREKYGLVFTPEQDEAQSKVLASINKQIKQIEATAEEHDIKPAPNTSGFLMIEAAVESMQSDDPYFIYAAQLLWRTGSAAAHGYPWRLLFSDEPASFDEKQFNSALYGSVLMTQHAMTLYSLRGKRHH